MVEGKTLVGRQRFQYVEQIVEDVKCKSYLQMKELAQNIEK